MNPKILCSDRIRKISGSFAFIEHRFLRDGFFKSLTPDELQLYLFLILAANKDGVSWYGYDKICSLLRRTVDEYITIRNSLLDKDLIASDGTFFQVLSLPACPPALNNGIPNENRGQGLVHISEIFKKMQNRQKI